MISGIIFDMDGVLIDSERQSNEGWLWAAQQLGVEMPMSLIDSFKGAPAELCCKFFDDYFKGKIDYYEAKKLRTQKVYEIRSTEGIPVKLGVLQILGYVKRNGLKCAVATSTNRESAEKTLHDIGVWDYLDAVVYGDEVENGKPEPDIFLQAAQKIDVKADECIVVEDSVNGIKAGYAAGMKVVHIPDTIVIDEDTKKLTYMVCDNLLGVMNVVESINKPYINRQNVINTFAQYVKSYNPSDKKISLKVEHTYRVAEICERIADSLGLKGVDVDIAWLLGMLHDVGRFEQIKRYNTFSDADSVDHAEFGADLLFKEGLIQKFIYGYYNSENADDEGLLELAIRQHNKYRLKEGLSQRQLMFCNILRDADKIDIFRVNAEIPMEVIYNVTTEQLKNGEITPAVLESFYKKETVLKNIRQSAVDNVVGHISLLFELVYKESYKIAKEQGYVYKLLEFKSNNENVNEQFAQMMKYVKDFLENASI